MSESLSDLRLLFFLQNSLWPKQNNFFSAPNLYFQGLSQGEELFLRPVGFMLKKTSSFSYKIKRGYNKLELPSFPSWECNHARNEIQLNPSRKCVLWFLVTNYWEFLPNVFLVFSITCDIPDMHVLLNVVIRNEARNISPNGFWTIAFKQNKISTFLDKFVFRKVSERNVWLLCSCFGGWGVSSKVFVSPPIQYTHTFNTLLHALSRGLDTKKELVEWEENNVTRRYQWFKIARYTKGGYLTHISTNHTLFFF